MTDRKPAMFSISSEGTVVTVKGTNGYETSFDIVNLPQAQRAAAELEGVKQFVRTSYANAGNINDGVSYIDKRIDGLRDGNWLPNTRGEASAKEPDDLALAVMQAVKITFKDYEEDFLPNWFSTGKDGKPFVTAIETKNGQSRLMGKAEALKVLANHEMIAPILAKLAADRAKARAKDKNSGPSLSAFVSTGSENSQEAAE